MEFDIFGSCLSRDGFEFENNNHKVNSYFARSSLVSVLKQPMEITNLDLNLSSNFLKRTVKDDLNKRFKSYVNNPKSSVIIIDLIQERYSLIKYERSLFTNSPDYGRANLPKGKRITNVQQLELYKNEIVNISKLFKNYDYVILHEANLAEKYYDKEGKLKSFNLSAKDKFFINQGYLYYKLLKENLSNVYSIKLVGFQGTENHKWGASPSHYQDEYYKYFNKGLEYIIENRKDYNYKYETF